MVRLILCALFLSQAPGLSNKEVVDLVKLGLSPEIVAARIGKSGCNFDTSPQALLELKTAGVPDSVTLAMIKAPCEGPQPAAERRKAVRKLHQVQRIYLDEMGQSDDAERFRMLLSQRLSEHFTVVGTPDEADAILKGVISTQLAAGTTKARTSVSLLATDGHPLWSDDFGVRFVLGPSRRDSIKLRAGDVANGLYGAWKKSVKSNQKNTNK